MGIRGLFEGWHFVLLIALVIVIFGWKRLPDAARSLGRSMRIFKSEVQEMKNDGKPSQSAASSDTVRGETVDPTQQAARPVGDPTQPPAGEAPQAHTPPQHQPPA
ncbi:MAG: Sec-independent protein translocase subunit TatA [Oryzihumus sp.]